MSSSIKVDSNLASTSCPWKKSLEPVTSISFSLVDVMSEQLASDLQAKETLGYLHDNNLHLEQIEVPIEVTNDTLNTAEDSDFMLAQLLQLELDKEADEALNIKEQFKNKNNRISISYKNFRTVDPYTDKVEKELNRINEPEVTESSDSEDEFPKMKFKRGVHGKGENMVSKHDIPLTSRHNASKVMTLPVEFVTGDTHGMELRLPNKVYNMLKQHSAQAEGRGNRLNDKQDKATNVISLDPRTRLLLFKLVNASILDSIGGVVSTGKEATIFYAEGGKTQELLVPAECVAKVFKTSLNEFKTRDKYIADDYRFKDRYKHLNPQKIVKLWAEKEMHNLIKMRSCDIPCPEAIILKKHVLIMSFIGKDSVPAPKLKDAKLNETQLKSAYEQSLQILSDLYKKCNLIHADFNAFNLLWHEDRLCVIDVSQSVEIIHPLGLEFLLRDCRNVHQFFTNRKLANVFQAEEIFNFVTNMKFEGNGDVFMAQIQKYRKDKELQLNGGVKEDKQYNFDYHFTESQKQRDANTNESSDSDTNETNDWNHLVPIPANQANF